MADDLVRLWLGESPAEDLDEYAWQTARAIELEDRTMKQLAGHLGQALAKALGGKGQ